MNSGSKDSGSTTSSEVMLSSRAARRGLDDRLEAPDSIAGQKFRAAPTANRPQ